MNLTCPTCGQDLLRRGEIVLKPCCRAWWHGGRPELPVGSWLLPPELSLVQETWASPHRPRLAAVYITRDPRVALGFAGMWGDQGGHLYRVEPFGPLRPDPEPDQPPGAYLCRRARILEAFVPTIEHISFVREHFLGRKA